MAPPSVPRNLFIRAMQNKFVFFIEHQKVSSSFSKNYPDYFQSCMGWTGYRCVQAKCISGRKRMGMNVLGKRNKLCQAMLFWVNFFVDNIISSVLILQYKMNVWQVCSQYIKHAKFKISFAHKW